MEDPQTHVATLLRHPKAPYNPSAWISCVLIFWTAACMVCDLSVSQPWIGIVFTVTTYAPTIYSAGKFILQGARRARTEAHDAITIARTRARRASIIAATWIVTATARVALRQLTSRLHAAYYVPERPALYIVIFVALRHVFDERARRRGAAIALPAGDYEESTNHQAPVDAYVYAPVKPKKTEGTEMTLRGTTAAYNDVDASTHMYRPSDTFLAVSILLCLLSLISEGLLLVFGIFTFSHILQATIPTIIFHIYMLARPDSELALRAQFVADADFSLELTTIWLATGPPASFRFIPGHLESIALSYMSVRCVLGLWNVLPRYEQPL